MTNYIGNYTGMPEKNRKPYELAGTTEIRGAELTPRLD